MNLEGCKKLAEWFDIAQVHRREEEMLIDWIRETTPSLAQSSDSQSIRESQHFKELEVEYKSHRDQIIKLYV